MYREDPNRQMPPRVQAALSYLYYCHRVTDQTEVSIPARPLETAERTVMQGALRVLGMYFDGEMDYGDPPPRHRGDEEDGDGSCAPEPVAK